MNSGGWKRKVRRTWRDSGKWSVIALAVLAVVVAGLAYYSMKPPAPPSTSATSGTPAALPTPACDEGAPQLARTRTAIRETPDKARIALLGDSTRDDKAAGLYVVQDVQANLSTVPAKQIKSFGHNGSSLAAYVPDPVQDEIRAFDPTMIELSIGINDLRTDQTKGDEFRAALGRYVEDLHADLPKTDLMLSVPAALSTQNVKGLNAITGPDGAVNPPGAAQAVTTELRDAYRAVAKAHRYVVLNDVQKTITGTKADPSKTPEFLVDQLHPNPETSQAIADAITTEILGTC